VFQHYSLFPWMTAYKNVIFAIQQSKKRVSKKEIDELAGDYLVKVGLSGFENKYPFQLSGGMQQRVAIARTLAMETEIIYMDEPFGAVDAKTRLSLQDLLSSLLARENRTIVFVTHDVEEAIFLSDRILFMDNKRITADIKVDIARPRDRSKPEPSEGYLRIRKKVMNLFNLSVAEKIGGEEVAL
jgi:NitT/TauT family transport system ATP-binding protein